MFSLKSIPLALALGLALTISATPSSTHAASPGYKLIRSTQIEVGVINVPNAGQMVRMRDMETGAVCYFRPGQTTTPSCTTER